MLRDSNQNERVLANGQRLYNLELKMGICICKSNVCNLNGHRW